MAISLRRRQEEGTANGISTFCLVGGLRGSVDECDFH